MPLTAEALARSLVSVGYPEHEIRATLVKRFPDVDADALIAAARKWEAGIELDLADAEEHEDRAAREAEHKEDG